MPQYLYEYIFCFRHTLFAWVWPWEKIWFIKLNNTPRDLCASRAPCPRLGPAGLTLAWIIRVEVVVVVAVVAAAAVEGAAEKGERAKQETGQRSNST